MTITITSSTLPTTVTTSFDNGSPSALTSTVPSFVEVVEFTNAER